MAYQQVYFNAKAPSHFEGLSTDTKPTTTSFPKLKNRDTLLETDTGDEYEYRGEWIFIKAGGGVINDREVGATSTRQSSTWTEAENVRRIVITAEGTAAESIFVCFDAPDDATATNWLATAGTASTPALRRRVRVGQPREFTFKNPLRRIDLLDAVGTVTGVNIEGGR